MLNRDSFIFYRSFYEAITELEDDQKGRVYDAIFKYGLDGECTDLKGIEKAIFTLIKPQLDANQRRFENGKKGAEYGHLGGRPKGKKTPKKPLKNPTGVKNKTPNVNENVNVNVNVNDYIVAFDLYNEMAGRIGLSKAQVLNDTRKRNLKSRLRDCDGLDGWNAALEKIQNSGFLTGDNDRGWKADLDFILKKNKFISIMEGRYDERKQSNNDKVKRDLADWVQNG